MSTNPKVIKAGKQITLGLAIILISIWLGALLLHYVEDTWAEVPTIITGLILVFLGAIIVLDGFEKAGKIVLDEKE